MTKKGSGFLGRNRRLRKKEEDAEALRLGLTPAEYAQYAAEDNGLPPVASADEDYYFDEDVPDEELQPSFGLEPRAKTVTPVDPNLALHDKRRGPPDRRQRTIPSGQLDDGDRRSNIENRRRPKFLTIDEMAAQ